MISSFCSCSGTSDVQEAVAAAQQAASDAGATASSTLMSRLTSLRVDHTASECSRHGSTGPNSLESSGPYSRCHPWLCDRMLQCDCAS